MLLTCSAILSIENLKKKDKRWDTKRFLHEFQSTGWSRTGFHRQMMKEGKVDINYDTECNTAGNAL